MNTVSIPLPNNLELSTSVLQVLIEKHQQAHLGWLNAGKQIISISSQWYSQIPCISTFQLEKVSCAETILSSTSFVSNE